jgi:hypothetical protein
MVFPFLFRVGGGKQDYDGPFNSRNMFQFRGDFAVYASTFSGLILHC